MAAESFVLKKIHSEEELTRWYEGMYDGDHEYFYGPNSILKGFELPGEIQGYPAETDVTDTPFTTCFDCGYITDRGIWNMSLEELLDELRKEEGVIICIYYTLPLVNPNEWGPQPDERQKQLMEEFLSRRKEREIEDYEYDPDLDEEDYDEEDYDEEEDEEEDDEEVSEGTDSSLDLS